MEHHGVRIFPTLHIAYLWVTSATKNSEGNKIRSYDCCYIKKVGPSFRISQEINNHQN